MDPRVDEDYYALLGVGAGAGAEEVRRAWRRLAARWHPDRAGVGATARFQRLSAAYAVLSDPVARAAYDRRRARAASAKGVSPPGAAAVSSAGAGAGGDAVSARSAARRPAAPGVMLSRLCGPLASLIARGAARVREPGYVELELSGREAAQGGMVMVSMVVDLRCPKCHGGGGSVGCRRCGGTGLVEELFSAWLAVRPGATEGEVLTPSVALPGMVEGVRFRVRVGGR